MYIFIGLHAGAASLETREGWCLKQGVTPSVVLGLPQAVWHAIESSREYLKWVWGWRRVSGMPSNLPDSI